MPERIFNGTYSIYVSHAPVHPGQSTSRVISSSVCVCVFAILALVISLPFMRMCSKYSVHSRCEISERVYKSPRD